MVGDALSDWNAARANGVLFYPIDPGHEDASWQRFFEEALPRFFTGSFAGEYMDAQLARFDDPAPRASAVELGCGDRKSWLSRQRLPILQRRFNVWMIHHERNDRHDDSPRARRCHELS